MIIRKCAAGVILIGVLIMAGVFIGGCSKGDSTSAQPVNPQTSPVGPTGPGAAVPGPTSAAPPPGVSATPSPTGYPGTQGPATNTAGSTPQSNPQAVPFSKAPIVSPVKRVTLGTGDAKMDFLQFKYINSQGVTCIAEMPAAEAETQKSPQEWLVTFDLYKKSEVPKSTTVKKSAPKPLSDFPFVSPPPPAPGGNTPSTR